MCVSIPKAVQSAFAEAGLRAVSDVHKCPGCLQWALLTIDEAGPGAAEPGRQLPTQLLNSFRN